MVPKKGAVDDKKRIGIGVVIRISIGSALIVFIFLLWGVYLLKSRKRIQTVKMVRHLNI